MSEYHYGDADEVRGLSTKLIKNVKEIKEISAQGNKLLQIMQDSVKDNAYTEAEEIVTEVMKLLMYGLDDVSQVAGQLGKYADYLDKMSR